MVPPTRSTPSLNPPSPRAYLVPAPTTTQAEPRTSAMLRINRLRMVVGFMGSVGSWKGVSASKPSHCNGWAFGSRAAVLGVLVVALGQDAGHAAAQHAQLDVGVVIDFHEQLVVLAGRRGDELGHGADQEAVDQHPVALLEAGDQQLLLFALLLHRADEQQVAADDDEQDREQVE